MEDILKINNLSVLEVSSDIFINNGIIPTVCSSEGKNIFPAIEVKLIPIETKTLVLVIENIDTKNEISLHLIRLNIPVDGEEMIINEDTLNKSNKLINDFGVNRWMGPCSQEGNSTHRYYFKIYGLNKKIILPENSKIEDIYKMIEKQKILTSYGELIGIY